MIIPECIHFYGDVYSHYEIREVGPVQEIHYVSDTEAATLRLVGYSTEDEVDRYWHVK